MQDPSVLNVCRSVKPRMLLAYDSASLGRKDWPGIWCGEQAQHRVGDRKGMGRGGCALDFQLSRRAAEGKRRGTGGRVWRENSVVSLRRYQRRGDRSILRKRAAGNRSRRFDASLTRI